MLDYNMTRLGYYAKDSNNNLFQYEWGYDEVFYIMINGEKTIADPNKYEVLDLSYSQKKEKEVSQKKSSQVEKQNSFAENNDIANTAYSIFCMFSQLSKEETKGYDCDEMWFYCHDLYSAFCDSEFNDENMSEIDAMNKFLENIEERIAWCKDNPPIRQYLIEGSEYDFEMLKTLFEHTSSFELPKLFELKNSHEKGELWYEKIEDEEVSHA